MAHTSPFTDRTSEVASIVEDVETCAWLSWARVESSVSIYRYPETCGLWGAQLLQEGYTSLTLTLKMVKQNPKPLRGQ